MTEPIRLTQPTEPVQPIRWTYAFVDRPLKKFGPACEFWTAVTRTKLSERRGERGEFVTLLPDGAADACVKAQGVAGSGPGAGGAHLDLVVEDVPALVRSALRLGADTVADHGDWAVLRSPGGQLFCAVPWHGESKRPPVIKGPSGVTSRLDQVCIDLAPAVYEAEIVFWSALTGWDSVPGALAEFHVIRPPAALPVRILLQRLGNARPTGAHIDIACSDIDAIRIRHELLGATLLGRGARWAVMRDPSGGTYCLTPRDPETGGLPAPSPPS
ncbi:VOC family protein [Streptomyces sp. NPDC127072]|uniref:VOC family protein n=1 Tax=Streptomyces sp. NPDC127072 TaxID=3347129 RepID=UPI00365377F2